jgi:hypothetical protein
MAKEIRKRMGVSNSPVQGTNPNHWQDPLTRDTTRGSADVDFDIMHHDTPRNSFNIVSCRYCGEPFQKPSDSTQEFCNNSALHLKLWQYSLAHELKEFIVLLSKVLIHTLSCTWCGVESGACLNDQGVAIKTWHNNRLLVSYGKAKEMLQPIPREQWKDLLLAHKVHADSIPALIQPKAEWNLPDTVDTKAA